MEDQIAQEIVAEWGRENTDSSNTMNLYQQVADHFFQRENNITSSRTPGEDKSLPIIDPTGRIAFNKMCAGLSAVMFPAGQYFHRLSPESSTGASNKAISWLNGATEITHNELFKPSCNFILEINETIMSWAGFGTGDIQSFWDRENLQLMFRDWDVANFRFGVDAYGKPNRCLIRWAYTAQQAYELWGDKAGEKVVKAAIEPKTANDKFWFIWRTRPRKNRDVKLSNVLNYRFEEVVVNESEKIVVEESGYKSFPHHIARWLTSSQEKWGYGQGVFGLSADKDLQTDKKALKLCAALSNTPPYQSTSDFEGNPKIYPGGHNKVMKMDSIKALDRTMQGNFPISKDTLEMTKEDLRDIFFNKVFAPLDNLTGDRRNELEIQARISSGFVQLVLPVTRFYNECLTPLIERCVQMLFENHRFDSLGPMPEELAGFKVEYLGRLALAIQEQQADALARFASFTTSMDAVVPNYTADTINTDRAGRRMATTFGVNESDLNTDEEKAAIRQERAKKQQQLEMMQAAQAASESYKNASGAAEEGSPAQQMQEAL